MFAKSPVKSPVKLDSFVVRKKHVEQQRWPGYN